ncbi:MAG: hypothetical protein IT167_28210 [Bryobacterales bacterium]|nr:hypothetical protein [Bryobacterales bacterium]
MQRRKDEPGNLIVAPKGEEDPDNAPPKFSLRYLSPDYCITACNKEEKAAFADTMKRMSQLTWAQLRQAPRHGLGYEKIERESIRARIPEVITADVNIIAFRFHGKAPMVGFRAGDGTFHVIWFDRGFQLYGHS